MVMGDFLLSYSYISLRPRAHFRKHRKKLLPPFRLAPRGDELVINKTTYGAFVSTGLENTLRNLAIDTLVIGGVVTNVCVETTARDACDRGFDVLLIEDACAAFSPEAHAATMLALQGPFASVLATDALLEALVE